jgi:hypothetical protein
VAFNALPPAVMHVDLQDKLIAAPQAHAANELRVTPTPNKTQTPSLGEL